MSVSVVWFVFTVLVVNDVPIVQNIVQTFNQQQCEEVEQRVKDILPSGVQIYCRAVDLLDPKFNI